MKQILHLAKKDLTRHWLIASLVVVAIALDAFDTRYGLFALSNFFGVASWGFTLLKWPLCFLFAVAVVQEDNTTGDRSHWLTRPIEPLALLGAKLLSIFVIVVMPQALSSGLVALSIDAPPSTAAIVVAESLGLTFVLCLGAVLFAALTRSVLHAGVWIGALLLVTFFSARLLQTQFPDLLKSSPAAVAAGGPSQVIATLLFLVPSLLAVLGFHFRRRSIAISATASIAVLLFTPIIALHWPWQLISPPAVPAPAAAAREYIRSKISVQQIGQARTNGFREAYDSAARALRVTTPVMLPVSVERDRVDRVIEGVSATTTLQFPDGTSRTFTSVNSWLFSGRLSTPLAVALGLPFRTKPTREEPRQLNLFGFPANENPIPPERPANATVKVSFDESEVRLIGRFPLVLGTHFQTDAWREIAEITHHPGADIRIRLRELQLSSLRHPDPSRTSADALRVALYNRKLREFSIGRFARSTSSSGPGAIRNGTVDYEFPSRNSWATEAANLNITADWLADAELIVFRAEKIGRTEQTLHIENLFVADRELPVTRLVD